MPSVSAVDIPSRAARWRRSSKPIPARLSRRPLRSSVGQQLPRSLVALPVFLLLMRIAFFMKGRGDTGFGYIDAYAVVEILLTGAAILLLVWDPATLTVLRVVKRAAVGWLLLYYVIGVLSTLWSPMPLYTFFRGVQVLSQFLAVFVILAQARSFAAMELTFLAAGALAIILEVAGVVRLFGGVSSLATLHTCSYSNVGLVLFTYCLAEYAGCSPNRRRTLLAFGAIGLAAVVVGTSATTNVSAVLGVLVAMILSGRRRGLTVGRAVLLGLLLLAGVLAWFMQDTLLTWLLPNKTAEDIQSFTGRRLMWEQLSGLFYESPLWGHGFVASTRTGDIGVYNAHNVLLQALLDTGILGTLILGVALLALGLSCLRGLRQRSAGSAGFAAAFSALLLVNVTVPVWGVGWDKPVFAWAFLVGLHTLALRRRSQVLGTLQQPGCRVRRNQPVRSQAGAPSGGRSASRRQTPRIA